MKIRWRKKKKTGRDVTLKSRKFLIPTFHDTLSLRYPTDLDDLTVNFTYTDDPYTTNDKEKLEFQTQKTHWTFSQRLL